jgi:hypothetical protein
MNVLNQRYEAISKQKVKAGDCNHCLSQYDLSEPIPAKVKAKFFTDREVPNLMKEYDVIGFSSSAIKFKNEALNRLIIKSTLADLVTTLPDFYSDRLMNFDYDNNTHVCMRNLVWDVQKGLVIKLNEGSLVERAFSGFEELTKEQI